MKKLICLLFVLALFSVCYAVNKNVVYNKDTGEIIAIASKTIATKDANRVNIICENGAKIYGANTAKITTTTIDEKSIPADIDKTTYKINTGTKEIYQEVILEEIK